MRALGILTVMAVRVNGPKRTLLRLPDQINPDLAEVNAHVIWPRGGVGCQHRTEALAVAVGQRLDVLLGLRYVWVDSEYLGGADHLKRAHHCRADAG
jgi:hypothetical protein